MIYHNFRRIFSAAGLVTLAACGGSPSESSSNLSDAEMLTLVLSATAGAQTPGTVSCPAGGEVTGTGSSNSSTSGEITAFDFDLNVTYDSCARPHGQRILTLDGNARYTGLIRVSSPEGGPSEILDAAYRLTGSLRWQGEDVDVACGFDITSTFQPSVNRYSVAGEICGRDVSQTVTY